jgi:hypothetical protein
MVLEHPHVAFSGAWLVCALTDERGELLETRAFLRRSFSSAAALFAAIWRYCLLVRTSM